VRVQRVSVHALRAVRKRELNARSATGQRQVARGGVIKEMYRVRYLKRRMESAYVHFESHLKRHLHVGLTVAWNLAVLKAVNEESSRRRAEEDDACLHSFREDTQSRWESRRSGKV
jgi:hypothetical protein